MQYFDYILNKVVYINDYEEQKLAKKLKNKDKKFKKKCKKMIKNV